MITASDVNNYAPTSSASVAVATAASTFVSVTGYRRVWIKSSVDAHVKFGASAADAAVTTTNIYLTAGQDYAFDRRVMGSGPDLGFKVKLKSGESPGTVWYASV